MGTRSSAHPFGAAMARGRVLARLNNTVFAAHFGRCRAGGSSDNGQAQPRHDDPVGPAACFLQTPLRSTMRVAVPPPTPTSADSRAAVSWAASAWRPTNTAPAPALPAADTLALYAQVLAARSLESAAHALVAALAAGEGLGRAALGWHEDGRTRLLASSHLDLSQPQAEATQRLLGAMDEAIDQSRSLCWPWPAESIDEGIRIEQQALQRLGSAAVASVPLGCGGEVFAVLCVERESGAAFTAAELAQLEQRLSLAAPALRWMQQGAEPAWKRLQRDALRLWQRLRQPDRATTRRLIVAAALGFAFIALAPLQREVGGRARVEGAEQRVLVAPTDGFIKQAHVRPGDQVVAGQVLVDLLDGDLRLERERWTSQLAQHENAYAAAMAKSDRTTASTSLARISEAQSQLALVDEQLPRGRVTAPFDALVIQGDLSQSIGAPVRQGDTLLTLATTGRHRVIVEVDEVDIARVQPGQGGQLSLSSLPWDTQALVVERITPLAKAVDGRNVFEVEARLLAPRADLRPGLLGRAEHRRRPHAAAVGLAGPCAGRGARGLVGLAGLSAVSSAATALAGTASPPCGRGCRRRLQAAPPAAARRALDAAGRHRQRPQRAPQRHRLGAGRSLGRPAQRAAAVGLAAGAGRATRRRRTR